MKFILVMLLLCIWSSSNGAMFSLADLIKEAEVSNYGLKLKENSEEKSIAEVDVAHSKYFPRLGIDSGLEVVKSENVDETDVLLSVYAEYNLFNGFKDQLEMEKRKEVSNQSKKNTKVFRLLLSLDIEEKYYEYLFSLKKLEIVSEEVMRIRNHRELVRKRYRSKLITEADYLEFLLNDKKLQTEKKYLILESEQILTEILSLTGVKKSGDIELVGSLPHLKLENTLESLLEKIKESPRYQESIFDENVTKLDGKMIDSEWLPTVDLKLEYGRLDDSETGVDPDQTSSQVTLSANWEFFSGFGTQKRKDAHQLKKTRAYLERKRIERQGDILIRKLYGNLKILEETIDSKEENEKLAKKLYRESLSDYRKGVRDSGALGSASNLISESQKNIYQLKLSYIKSKIALERTLGRKLNFLTIEHKEIN